MPAHRCRCALCAAGKYKSAAGPDPCEPCPNATFQTAAGATACTPCPDNSFSESVGMSSAAACLCDPGFAAGPDGCVPCPLGTYKDSQGQEACSPCDQGSFAGEVGQTACSLCEPVPRPACTPARSLARIHERTQERRPVPAWNPDAPGRPGLHGIAKTPAGTAGLHHESARHLPEARRAAAVSDADKEPRAQAGPAGNV